MRILIGLAGLVAGIAIAHGWSAEAQEPGVVLPEIPVGPVAICADVIGDWHGQPDWEIDELHGGAFNPVAPGLYPGFMRLTILPGLRLYECPPSFHADDAPLPLPQQPAPIFPGGGA